MARAAQRKNEQSLLEEEFPAINAILGANPFVGLNGGQVMGTLVMMMRHLASRPATVASRAMDLWLELGEIAAGSSAIAPEANDKRFSDPAFRDHPLYHRLMQSYLAWRGAMHGLVNDGDGADWKESEQRKFAVTLLTEALAPTNALAGNPAALKRAFETSGMS
ncbi:MAG: hypothetical protein ACREQB_09125, partial [Candidatus Binataceae bacterium]